jgi:DNA invertase Pin-like site-specific DNA recombinase
LVHSFSRFFRDQFQLEFYVRRLAKNGVRLVSITQELGDDPMSNMIRQIMALFDEYQSKENAKHTLRAMKENARQGFWNGSLPPIGYRIVEAAEQHGHRIKKALEIDPIQAETVRQIFRLAREGDGSSGPMGVKKITKHLNAAGIRTRDGGRWGIGAVHKVLTRTTYVGRHRFNTKFWKTRERKPDIEVVEMAAPPIIDAAEFGAVQALLKTRSPAVTAPRIVSGPTLLTGICFCAACGRAMTLRTGKSGRYRYYTCSTKARQGETGCMGRTVPMEKLASSKSCHPCSTAAGSGPSGRRHTLPHCASDRRKRTPSSSGSTTRSRTALPISRTRCSRTALPSSRLSAIRPAPTQSGPRVRWSGSGRASHRRSSKHSPGRPAGACAPRAAATAAITSARSPNASKWTRKKFASKGPKAYCCVRSSPSHA